MNVNSSISRRRKGHGLRGRSSIWLHVKVGASVVAAAVRADSLSATDEEENVCIVASRHHMRPHVGISVTVSLF